MARLKQRYYSFKTAERLYIRRKQALREEYGKLMCESAKKGDWVNFDALVTDARADLGENVLGLTIIMCEKLRN